MSNEGMMDKSRLHSRSPTTSHACNPLTNNSLVSKLKSRDEHIISNVPPQIGEFDSMGPNLTQESKDLPDELIKKFPLPLKKRYSKIFNETCLNESTEIAPGTDLDKNNLDCLSFCDPYMSREECMKYQKFEQEFDNQQGCRSHEKHESEKVNLLEIPIHGNQHCLKPSLTHPMEEPLDLSVHDIRTNEHRNDKETLQGRDRFLPGTDLSSFIEAPLGSVRSDVEINGSQNGEQIQKDNSLPQQISIDNQQESSEYPLLYNSKHEEETLTTSMNLPDPIQKELEELESSIAVDCVSSNSPSHQCEPDTKGRKFQVNDVKELDRSSLDDVAETETDFTLPPLVDKKRSDSLKNDINGVQEDKETCSVEEMQSDEGNKIKVNMVEEETLGGNSHVLQPVLWCRMLQRKKSRINVDNCSFTRLPRNEQMRIDPTRAMRLREENNAACRKNRLKRAQKMQELEEELARLKELKFEVFGSLKLVH